MKGFASTLVFGLLALTLLAPADWAEAKPSDAQIAAIKANCRSDFMSKCWGVKRGGPEAMQCLKDHMASVSPGCQQALKALTPPKAAPAAAKPESAPAPAPQPAPETTAKTAPAAPEPKPDTATAPPPSAPASEPAPAAAPKAAAKTPEKAAPPATAPAKTKQPTAAPAPAPAASEAAPVIIGRLPPRKKLMVLRNCRKELDTYCGDVDYGDGRQLQCLFSHKASLSSDCQGVLAKLTN